jgi:hypothetical protein
MTADGTRTEETTMTQEPRREVEVQGRAGDAVALPVGNDGATPYTWTLDLPPGVEAAGTTAPPPPLPGADAGGQTGSRLLVRADEPGSYVLTATLADPWSPTPMTVLPIRLTVA